MIAWLKSQRWFAMLGGILAAILLVLAAKRATRFEKRAADSDAMVESLLNETADKHLDRVMKLNNRKIRDLDRAAAARKTIEINLERLGEADQSFDELVHHFNSNRVRLRDDGTDPF